MEHKVQMEFERETKRKYRYRETGEEALLGTLYVSKTLFDERPDRIEVTLRLLE